jgi:hypothetical protein
MRHFGIRALPICGVVGMLTLTPLGGKADCDDLANYPPVSNPSCGAAPTAPPYPNSACLNYQPIPQCLPLLCWAATGQVAMNSFVSTTHQSVAQWEMVQTHKRNRISADDPCFHQLPEGDAQNPSPCDVTGDPDQSLRFFAYDFDTRNFGNNTNSPPPCDPTHLCWEEIQQEIAGRGHPALFEWTYEDGANHYLVITGYYTTSTKKKKLRIWDPLPVAVGSARAINFATYAAQGGSNDMGRPVWHFGDYYNVHPNLPGNANDVRVGRLQPAALTSEPVAAAVATPPSLYDVSIDEARRTSLPAARDYLHELQLEQSQEPGGSQTLQLGLAFPVIALGLNDLIASEGHSPLTLLRTLTHVALYPVEARDGVLDSFLTIRGPSGWAEGGYANITVTQRLDGYRRQYAVAKHLPESSFYLLSVPALSAFFAAVGAGSDTLLIPATDDASLGARAGQPQRAIRLIPRLIAAAQRYRPVGPRLIPQVAPLHSRASPFSVPAR